MYNLDVARQLREYFSLKGRFALPVAELIQPAAIVELLNETPFAVATPFMQQATISGAAGQRSWSLISNGATTRQIVRIDNLWSNNGSWNVVVSAGSTLPVLAGNNNCQPTDGRNDASRLGPIHTFGNALSTFGAVVSLRLTGEQLSNLHVYILPGGWAGIRSAADNQLIDTEIRGRVWQLQD